MSRSLELSANDKTTTKLTEDFYQSVFDPFKHTTLQESVSDFNKEKAQLLFFRIWTFDSKSMDFLILKGFAKFCLSNNTFA